MAAARSSRDNTLPLIHRRHSVREEGDQSLLHIVELSSRSLVHRQRRLLVKFDPSTSAMIRCGIDPARPRPETAGCRVWNAVHGDCCFCVSLSGRCIKHGRPARSSTHPIIHETEQAAEMSARKRYVRAAAGTTGGIFLLHSANNASHGSKPNEKPPSLSSPLTRHGPRGFI